MNRLLKAFVWLITPLRVLLKDRKAGKIMGVPITISGELPLIFATFGMILFIEALRESGLGFINVVVSFLAVVTAIMVYGGILVISLLFHEFAHILVARKHGIKCQGIRLMIIGAQASLECEKKFDTAEVELPVALAGPASSAFLAGIAAILELIPIFTISPFRFMRTLNLVLVVFNFIPAYPMDGGRILRAILGRWFDPYKSTIISQATALCIFTAFIPIGFLTAYKTLPIIGMFLGFWVFADWVTIRSALKERYKLSNKLQTFLNINKEELTTKDITQLVESMEDTPNQKGSLVVICEILATLVGNQKQYDYRQCRECTLSHQKCIRYEENKTMLKEIYKSQRNI